ncbi:MAG TPA: universal stress protein [Dissulfurispiraceae bacterium]|nr:universal stress protein [Dissulfurispiraceae bacterium]
MPASTTSAVILAPMDDKEMTETVFRQLVGEAQATLSRVLLLGIIPIHLYSSSEEIELELVKKATLKAVDLAVSRLQGLGIQAEGAIRMGYPDEEIMKAAEERHVSMIVISCSSDQYSELTKAASIILDEIKQVKIPVLYVPA